MHRVTVYFEGTPSHAPHSVFVLDEQYLLIPRPGQGAGRSTPSLGTHRGGKENAEGRACARRALHEHVAAALLHDAEHGRESEPCSLPRLLGGEERIEDACLRWSIHTDSIVDHVDSYIRARHVDNAPLRGFSREFGVGGADGHRRSLGAANGIARVDHQVHDHLLDLARIRQDAVQVGSKVERQPAMLAKQHAKDSLEVPDTCIQVERLGAKKLLAAEGEELCRECRRPIGRLVDLVEKFRRLIVRRDRHLEQRGKPLDRGQQVVEVVSHAARKQPHGLHLLGHAKLRLELSLRRDVHRHHDRTFHRAVVIAHGR